MEQTAKVLQRQIVDLCVSCICVLNGSKWFRISRLHILDVNEAISITCF